MSSVHIPNLNLIIFCSICKTFAEIPVIHIQCMVINLINNAVNSFAHVISQYAYLIIQFAFPVDIDLVSVYGSCILSPINVCHIICTCRVVSSYLQFTVIWDVSTCLVYNCIEWLACSPRVW